jgi:catechol 2,3-dioxygenase-like lactoylglutathione lyase family enzyme
VITGLAHVGCSVGDLDEAMRFYNEYMGIEHGRTQLSDQPYLSDVNGLPGCRIRIGFALIEGDSTPLEVLQYLNPQGQPTGAAFGRPGSPHLCWQVDDLDAALERLQQWGLTALGPPRRIEHGLWSGATGAFLHGPGGVLTELIASPRSTGQGRLQRMHHVGYQVSSLEASMDFMVEILGLELESRSSYDDAYYASSAGKPQALLRSAFLTFPGSSCQLELLEFRSPDAMSADMANFNIGAMHCCFMVDDIHATQEAMMAAGVEFVGPPAEVTAGVNKGAFAIYFKGPDGLRFELFQGQPTSVAG